MIKIISHHTIYRRKSLVCPFEIYSSVTLSSQDKKRENRHLRLPHATFVGTVLEVSIIVKRDYLYSRNQGSVPARVAWEAQEQVTPPQREILNAYKSLRIAALGFTIEP